MSEMRYDPPSDIYKQLDLDKGPLDNKMDNAAEAGRARETRKINYAVVRDLLLHRNKPPPYLAYFNKQLDSGESTVSREEFWFMLNDEERAEIIREHYEDAVELSCQRIRSKAAGDHYQSCLRHIRGGQDAIRKQMRESNTTRQRAVDSFFVNRKKRRTDRITADLTEGITLPDLDEEEFM